MADRRDRPVILELDEATPGVTPAEAPPVPEDGARPTGQAMRTAAALAARPPSTLGRWFWRLLFALLTFGLTLWAWDAVTGLIARNEVLGTIALVLLGLFLAVCAAIVIREWAALARLARLDHVQKAAAAARAANDLAAARKVADRIAALYAGRPELAGASTAWPSGGATPSTPTRSSTSSRARCSPPSTPPPGSRWRRRRGRSPPSPRSSPWRSPTWRPRSPRTSA
jgi:hypothetical protein